MATNEELFRLVLEIQGQERVAKLSSDVAIAERELSDMAAAANLMGTALPVAQMGELANRIAGLKGQLAQAEGQVNAFGNAEAAAAAKADQAAQRAEAAAARKAIAAEKAAQRAAAASEREAAAAEKAAVRRIVADDKADAMTAGGSAADRRLDRSLRRAVGPGGADNAGGMDGKTGKARSGSQFFTMLGQSADDAQYGFRGISNNIQPLLQSIPEFGGKLGAAAGVLANYSGLISIAAIGVYQLYTHWDQLVGSFGGGIPQPALTGPELLAANLKKASDEMETLQKKSSLTWFELEKLNKLKDDVKATKQAQKDEATVEKILETPAKAVKEQGDAFGKAIAEVGGQNALGEVKGNLEETKDGKGLVFNVVTRTMTTTDQAARDMLRAASEGDELAAAEIRKNLKSGSMFGAAIDREDPGRKKAEKERDKEREDDEASERIDNELKFKAEEYRRRTEEENQKEADDDEVKRLNIEARENEKAYDEKVKLEKEDSKARMDAPGLDEFIKGEIMAGASEGDLAGTLKGLGFSDEESAGLLDKGAKGAMEAGLKGEEARSSQTLQGGQALRDAIQGGVTNEDVGKQQLDRLNAAVGYLQRIADQRPDMTARAT